jgi:ABC-type uncharacterized transport system permease subunit
MKYLIQGMVMGLVFTALWFSAYGADPWWSLFPVFILASISGTLIALGWALLRESVGLINELFGRGK